MKKELQYIQITGLTKRMNLVIIIIKKQKRNQEQNRIKREKKIIE